MTYVFVLLIMAAVVLAVVRFVRGPTDVDRIIAIDILFSAAIAFCAAAAWQTGLVLYLDVAIGVALVGFVATLAWARVLVSDAGGEDAVGSDL